MITYILMRNNKQSESLSLEELRQIQFKPYDLIWIEGKSAMWRYPSEISELQDIAEPVEEHLYDMIYPKKKSAGKISSTPNSSHMKHVFVSIPAKPKKEFIETTTQELKSETPVVHFQETVPASEIKFSQPLETIKETFTDNLTGKKLKAAQQSAIIQSTKRISIYLGLIVFGIILGYFFFYQNNKKKSSIVDNTLMQERSVIPAMNPTKKKSDTYFPSDKLNSVNVETQQSFPLVEEIKKSETFISKDKKTKTRTLSDLQKKEKVQHPLEQKTNEQFSPGAEINNKTGERNKKSRNESDETNQQPVNPAKELFSLVSVKSNNYQRGAFGGIRNLELTITNQSKYLLDKVIVELQYLKPNEQSLRSENIVFSSIPPDGDLTIAVPPNNRGVKVAYKILKVESKELANETAGL